jgi:hypothetical protein
MPGTARYALPLLLLFIIAGCASPSKIPSTGMIVGYHGFGEHYAEIGWMGFNPSIFRHGIPGSQGYSVSTELHLGDHFIVGGTGSAWISFLYLELGLNGSFYTDFREAAVALRPEIGASEIFIGNTMTRVVLGANIPIVNRNFDGIASPELAVRTVIPF